jgi:flagellar hook-associated protein 1 FlgK
MTTFSGFNTVKSGIFAAKKAMEVTANNIANVNTEGYTRQRAVLSSATSYLISNMHSCMSGSQVGNGVVVDKIEAIRDEFTNSKIVNETAVNDYKHTASDLLDQVEHILNQVGTVNLSGQMDAYWSAWENLSNDPSNTALRKNLTQETETLIGLFQEVDYQLRQLQGTSEKKVNGSIENQLKTAVKEVNSLAADIASLNKQIARSEVSGAIANELRDKRQVLVEELAGYINIESYYSSDGQLSINTGGHQLVQHGAHNEIYINDDFELLGSVSFATELPQYSKDPSIAEVVLTHTDVQSNGNITVTQLAQAHEQYSFLTYHPLTGPLSGFGVSSGSFVLNGREFYIDAEKTSLEDLAGIINGANIEINASINEAGQILLKSNKTGADYAICSEDGTSNLISVLNLNTAKEAKDAIFNYRDQEYISSTNTITNAVPGAKIYLNGVGATDLDMRPVVTGGKIKALLEVRDNGIQNTLDMLNDLAYAIMVETNDVHRGGFTLDGKTGVNYFAPVSYSEVSYPYKDYIQQMALSDAVKADLGNIAAASGYFENDTDRLKTSKGGGDGSNAILIAQLKQGKFFNEGRTTFDAYYNEIVTTVATLSRQYANEAEYSDNMLAQLKNIREENSGVSLDEELANLIKFQHAYNAAARVMTTLDAMIDKVVNQMI